MTSINSLQSKRSTSASGLSIYLTAVDNFVIRLLTGGVTNLLGIDAIGITTLSSILTIKV